MEEEIINQRIFYTGDMANIEGWGSITDKKDDEWGLVYSITMDDGRVFRGLYPSMFEKSGGQRFKLEAQVRGEKEEMLKRFEARYGKRVSD